MGRCVAVVWRVPPHRCRVVPARWSQRGGSQEGQGHGCIGRGGEVPPPPPSRAPSLCPATVPLKASASTAFVTDSNRPQLLWRPPPTAWTADWHLRVSFCVTERYPWSCRPRTSRMSSCALCCLPLVQALFIRNLYQRGGCRAPEPHTHGKTERHVMEGPWTEACGQQTQSNDPRQQPA